MEADLPGDVGRIAGDLVAVAVGQRDRHAQRARTQQGRVVRCVAQRILVQRQVLLHRDHACGRVDRDRKGRLAIERTARDLAHHHAVGQRDQVDGRAVRDVQARGRIRHVQRIHRGTAGGRAVRTKGLGVQRDDCSTGHRMADVARAADVQVVALDD